MRKQALRGLAATLVLVDEFSLNYNLARTGRTCSHGEFSPTKPGTYTLQECPLCKKFTLLGERIPNREKARVVQVTVRSPYQNSPKEKE